MTFAEGECNNGMVTTRSIDVLTNNENTTCYRSQLIISINSTDINNKTVICRHVHNEANETLVDTATVIYNGV